MKPNWKPWGKDEPPGRPRSPLRRPLSTLHHVSPPVWRILLHSSLFGLASSVADLLFNFYLVSLGYGTDTAGLLSTVNRMAGVVSRMLRMRASEARPRWVRFTTQPTAIIGQISRPR